MTVSERDRQAVDPTTQSDAVRQVAQLHDWRAIVVTWALAIGAVGAAVAAVGTSTRPAAIAPPAGGPRPPASRALIPSPPAHDGSEILGEPAPSLVCVVRDGMVECAKPLPIIEGSGW